MNKNDVIEFFDSCAPWWDDDMIRNEDLISTILTLGGIRPGIDVLDVACGTGVLFPDYLERGVNSVTAIDISPEMAKLAQSKFPEVKVICGDVEQTEFDRQFDAVMIYNAFPHFPDPARLVGRMADLVKPGGRLTVAHGMSRDALTTHHQRASKVSIDLLEEKELAKIFENWFDVDVVVSTDRMYQVSGVRRDPNAHSHGGHTHSHPHGQEHADTPLEELLALMQYMVKHNDAHAQELADLAGKLEAVGKDAACSKLMDTVAEFDMVNARLEAIRRELSSNIE